MGRQKRRRPSEQTEGRPRAARPPGLAGELAERIEGLRDAHGLTQPILAKRSGVGAGTIGRLERGDVDPRLSTVAAIAKAFGLTARELMQPCNGW
jgi:DNA-binding XRE family transcriptional regulator